MYPKFKCNTVSVSFSACMCSCSLIKGREKMGEKKSLETVLRMAFVAVACLPAAVSLLMLE
jgi:hypothetical protein